MMTFMKSFLNLFESLLVTVKGALAKFNIEKNACVGQCYDGASVMSGCNNGVQEKLRREVPHGSVTHKVFMEKQTELEPTKRAVELKRLSDTRWACQYYSLWAIKQTLPSHT